jgi:hypothetical protein
MGNFLRTAILIVLGFVSSTTSAQTNPQPAFEFREPFGKPPTWYGGTPSQRPRFGMTMEQVERLMKGTSDPTEGIGYVTKLYAPESEEYSISWHYEKDTKFVYWVYSAWVATAYKIYDSATVSRSTITAAIAVNFDRTTQKVVNVVRTEVASGELIVPGFDLHTYASMYTSLFWEGKNSEKWGAKYLRELDKSVDFFRGLLDR